jgi:AcrR family transcriptional regulator
MGAVSKLRRTQEERSAGTRGALLDAAIDCILDLGWSRTTTTEIAVRAGVSRGAQLHHFPSKAELVTEAVEHLFARRIAEARAAFARLPAGGDPAAAMIDVLWAMFTGPAFYVALELTVAARTDATLRARVADVHRRFTDNVRQTFDEMFPAPADRSPFWDVLPPFVFSLLEGMALGKIIDPNDDHRTRILTLLKALSPVLDGGSFLKEKQP